MQSRSLTALTALGTSALLVAACSSTASTDAHASHAAPMMGVSASPMTGASPIVRGDDDAGETASGSMTDVMFAQMMIPHHEQAIEMADLALANPDASPQLRDLATQIKAAQQPEIEAMTAWLAEWGVPSMASGDDAAGHDMGDHGMGGMMTEDEMKELEAAKGDAFNRLWLTLMIKHHQGALDMANGVLTGAKDQRVIDLANAILVSQAAEIATMQGMLASP